MTRSDPIAEYEGTLETLIPGIAARADEAAQLRRLPLATVKELRESGLWKALQPKRYGGLELEPIVLYRATARIAEACGSTAWVFGILGVHPWQLALFPDETQAEVWGDDDSTLVASTYAPVGRVTRTEGGFRLSGQWPWSSGTDHCDWVMLGGVDLSDPAQPDMRTFLLPRKDYEIVDTWHSIGLQGTGTNDVLVRDAFVPEARTLSFADTSRCDCPGNAVNPNSIYRLPFASVFATAIAAASLGIARGALLCYGDVLSTRFKIAYGEAAREDPHGQIKLAEATSVLDAGWLQLERNIVELTEAVHRGESADTTRRARLRHDQTYAVRRAVEVIDRCFDASGGAALRKSHPLQRFWRDLHGARHHAINDYERAAVLYGQVLLGIDVGAQPML
jgi:3-hydroxy-9,10-secoandrosta-1,3,5(10)-triene-9,17-dione monooxygenase